MTLTLIAVDAGAVCMHAAAEYTGLRPGENGSLVALGSCADCGAHDVVIARVAPSVGFDSERLRRAADQVMRALLPPHDTPGAARRQFNSRGKVK